MPIFTIEEMIQFIEGLINQKNIKIEKNNTDLKIYFNFNITYSS